MRIAVIGAGAAGLAAIKHAKDLGCEVVAFEQMASVGGTWVYTDRVGKDEHGIDVHSSMYKNLETNLPVEVMSYPDEDFPQSDVSFVTSEVVLQYYESYARKYKLYDNIKFEHHVVRVRPTANGAWEVIAKNLCTGTYETTIFDAVLVCNGHYSSGFIPNYAGRNLYRGHELHSHDYRDPELYKGQDILVIGGNFSAVDVVQQTAKHAKRVIWSHHCKDQPDLAAFGPNVSQAPDVRKLTASGAEFINGSTEAVATIIYCTGYEYKFPFLSVDCGVSTAESFVKPLYKHCLSINRPTLGFIGLPNLICPNQMFSLQARFCLQFITGRKKLPSKEQMLAECESDLKARWARGLPPRKAHLMGHDIQGEYYRDLAVTAGIKPLKPVIAKMHKFTNINRDRDFINFRRFKYFVIDDENFEARPI